eukprot:GILJ01000341.1.p1 GENE.GILJ01000341.1~~GILJ01000341.1.p1  ORF type:complete len:363 (+),score=29.45 GILJ01000341.1:46-1134(+)
MVAFSQTRVCMCVVVAFVFVVSLSDMGVAARKVDTEQHALSRDPGCGETMRYVVPEGAHRSVICKGADLQPNCSGFATKKLCALNYDRQNIEPSHVKWCRLNPDRTKMPEYTYCCQWDGDSCEARAKGGKQAICNGNVEYVPDPTCGPTEQFLFNTMAPPYATADVDGNGKGQYDEDEDPLCVDADWSTVLSQAGFASCAEDRRYISGFRRQVQDGAGWSSVKAGQCCRMIAESTGRDCKPLANFGLTWGAKGWSKCSPGYFFSKLEKVQGDSVTNINSVECCRPKSFTQAYANCQEVDVSSPIATTGNVVCPDGQFIAGMYRESGTGVDTIHKLYCCAPKDCSASALGLDESGASGPVISS